MSRYTDLFFGAAMHSLRTNRLRVPAAAGVLSLVLLAATAADARLSILPGGRPTPRPTSSSTAPTPTPTAGGNASVSGCQTLIASESTKMLGSVRQSLGSCLTRGTQCLVDEDGSSACCEEAALACQGELNAIATATRTFRETIRGGACGALALERLLADDGLGFESNVCGSLVPPIAVNDHATWSDCVQLLLTRDVMHQVALTDVPRAAEALVCMGLDEVLAAALGEEPATCKPTPSPSPSATPIPTPSPIPTNSPTPGPPTPTPTPSPGKDGCQPRLFGPCADAPFTGCCNTKQHCALITGDDGPGFCIADPPSSTETPAPTATPTPAPTSSGSAPTPTSTVAPTPTGVPTVGPTPTPAGSPGEPTPTGTAAAGCSTATLTVTTSYQAQAAPDFIAGVTTMIHYPGTLLDIPGTGNQSTVLARVTNLSGASGLFSAGDQDSDQSGTDDLLSVGMISTASAVAPGTFARVVFDCAAGQRAPTAADFSCTPDVSSLFGTTIDATCSVALATAP